MAYEVAYGIGYTTEPDVNEEHAVWVIELESNQILALGMPGSAIWLAALHADDSAGVVSELSKQYGWDFDVIEADVTNFVSDLVARGWLKEKVNP